MSPEQAVYQRLVEAASVQAFVADRVYQLTLPQTPQLPAVRVQLVDQPLDYHLRGKDGLTRSRVQVDEFVHESQGYALAEDLADAIDDELTGPWFTIGSPPLMVASVQRQDRRVTYEGGEKRHIRFMQDYFVWSRVVN